MVVTFLVLFFMRIPKLVSELCFTEFWFLTSREVRSGLFLTFDPNFDPLKMRNEKKRRVLSFTTFFERNPNLQSEFNFDHFEILTPFGGSYLTPWPLTPLVLHFPNIFCDDIHMKLKLRNSTWDWYNGEVPNLKNTPIIRELLSGTFFGIWLSQFVLDLCRHLSFHLRINILYRK